MQFTTHSAEETESIAAKLVFDIARRTQGYGNAPVIGLVGELGAGKTTFMKGVARALGLGDVITSPTFVIEKVYDLPDGDDQPYERLVHIDAYRLEGGAELEAIGWNDILSNPKNIIFIEWPELVEEVMPLRTEYITLTVEDDEARTILYGEEN